MRYLLDANVVIGRARCDAGRDSSADHGFGTGGDGKKTQRRKARSGEQPAHEKTS